MTESVTLCLQGYIDDNREVWRTMVQKLPFNIGRRPDSDLVLPFGRVSHRHAKLFLRQGKLWLRDLGSTNGTFLNGKRVSEDCLLDDGDTVHFADHEFRLVSFKSHQQITSTKPIEPDELILPAHNFDRTRDFLKMLEDNRGRAVFQPLVALVDGAVIGYEVLGRGDIGGVETQPTELFYLAEALGLALELSSVFRKEGVDDAGNLPGTPKIFVNSHPSEILKSDVLLASLERLRQRHPTRHLVLEIKEAAVNDLSALRNLRTGLENLEIGIAFDNFATGQARLLELTDVSPEFIKFDRAWVKDLHRAPQRRLEIVETLRSLVTDMGIATVAEGIESQKEAEACLKVGFEYAQGYYFGRPSPVEVYGGRSIKQDSPSTKC